MNLKVDNKQLIQIGVAVAILVILLVFISSAAKAIKRLFGFDDDTPPYQDTPMISGAPLPIGFDATPMVTRLKEVHGWTLDSGKDSPRCKAYKALMDLGVNEFIMVCNEYYKNGGNTLRSDIESTFHNGCGAFSTNWQKKVLKRMDELKVYG